MVEGKSTEKKQQKKSPAPASKDSKPKPKKKFNGKKKTKHVTLRSGNNLVVHAPAAANLMRAVGEAGVIDLEPIREVTPNQQIVHDGCKVSVPLSKCVTIKEASTNLVLSEPCVYSASWTVPKLKRRAPETGVGGVNSKEVFEIDQRGSYIRVNQLEVDLENVSKTQLQVSSTVPLSNSESPHCVTIRKQNPELVLQPGQKKKMVIDFTKLWSENSGNLIPNMRYAKMLDVDDIRQEQTYNTVEVAHLLDFLVKIPEQDQQNGIDWSKENQELEMINLDFKVVHETSSPLMSGYVVKDVEKFYFDTYTSMTEMFYTDPSIDAESQFPVYGNMVGFDVTLPPLSISTTGEVVGAKRGEKGWEIDGPAKIPSALYSLYGSNTGQYKIYTGFTFYDATLKLDVPIYIKSVASVVGGDMVYKWYAFVEEPDSSEKDPDYKPGANLFLKRRNTYKVTREDAPGITMQSTIANGRMHLNSYHFSLSDPKATYEARLGQPNDIFSDIINGVSKVAEVVTGGVTAAAHVASFVGGLL